MKLVTLILALLTIVTSCNNTKTAAEETIEKPVMQQDTNTEITSSNYEIILEEPYGGLERPEERIIRSEKALNEVYTIINRFRRPGLTPPSMDFTKTTVIAIFLGEKTTGGHSVDVQSVNTLNNSISITYKVVSPKSGEFATTAICQPFCIIKIPYVKEKVSIKKIN